MQIIRLQCHKYWRFLESLLLNYVFGVWVFFLQNKHKESSYECCEVSSVNYVDRKFVESRVIPLPLPSPIWPPLSAIILWISCFWNGWTSQPEVTKEKRGKCFSVTTRIRQIICHLLENGTETTWWQRKRHSTGDNADRHQIFKCLLPWIHMYMAENLCRLN